MIVAGSSSGTRGSSWPTRALRQCDPSFSGGTSDLHLIAAQRYQARGGTDDGLRGCPLRERTKVLMLLGGGGARSWRRDGSFHGVCSRCEKERMGSETATKEDEQLVAGGGAKLEPIPMKPKRSAFQVVMPIQIAPKILFGTR